MNINNFRILINKISSKSRCARVDAIVTRGKQKDREKRKYFIDSGIVSVQFEDGWLYVYVIRDNLEHFITSYNKQDITAGLNAICSVLSLYENK